MRPVLLSADIASVASLIVAIATAAGLLATLWFQAYLPARHRPALSLEYERGSRDLNYLEHDRSTWLRFRVGNANGKDLAHAVEVLLADIKRDGKPMPAAFPARTLHWSDQEGRSRQRLDIPAGIYRHVDIGHILGDVSPDVFQVALEPPDPNPRETRERLGPGRYTLYLIVTAANANPVRYEAEVMLERPSGSPLTVEVVRAPTELARVTGHARLRLLSRSVGR